MFKPRNNKTKKKRPFVTTTSTANDEENQNDDAVNVDLPAAKQTKKRSRKKESKKISKSGIAGIGLSFQNDEEDDDDNEFDKKLKKKKKGRNKRKGVGFGAARIIVEEDDEADNNGEEEASTAPTGARMVSEHNMYGTEALQQLKDAQTYTTFSTSVKGDDVNDDDDDDVPVVVVEEMEPTTVGSLDQQKLQEQRRRRPTSIEDMENEVQHRHHWEQDYIPLTSTSTSTRSKNQRRYDPTQSSTVLTGDDAVNANIDYLSSFIVDAGDNVELLGAIQDEEADDMDAEWADKLARRGISTVNAGRTASTKRQTAASHVFQSNKQDMDRSDAATSEIMFSNSTTSSTTADDSVMKVKKAMLNAISRIQDTKSELSSSMERRKAEMQLMTGQKERYESEVAEGEKSSLWFQSTRRYVANLVGALRDLEPKLLEVEHAMLTLMEGGTSASLQRQRDCEDDLGSLLKERGMLDSVVGRIVERPSEETEQSNNIDEFGRDLSHLVNKERDARIRRRYDFMSQKVKELIVDHDCDETLLAAKEYGAITDAEESDTDEESLLSRKQALNMAIDAAISNISDEFLSLPGMVRVFQKWEHEFPDEFKSCFASTTFIGLASVLVRLELFQNWDSIGLFKQKCVAGSSTMSHKFDLEQLKFFSDLQECTLHDEGGEKCLAAVMAKSVVPFFMLVLERAYNPHSTFQTHAVCHNYACLSKHVPTKSVKNMSECVNNRLRNAVTSIALPIKSHEMNIAKCVNDDDKSRNLKVLTGAQTFRLKKFIVTICSSWAPLFESGEQDLAKTILFEAIATRLLPVLTRMREGPKPEKNAGTEILAEVVEAVKSTGWLDRSDLMLFASPLRAAINLFGL